MGAYLGWYEVFAIHESKADDPKEKAFWFEAMDELRVNMDTIIQWVFERSDA